MHHDTHEALHICITIFFSSFFSLEIADSLVLILLANFFTLPKYITTMYTYAYILVHAYMQQLATYVYVSSSTY